MFFPNYSKPGKGVNKRDPNQSIIVTFFEILPRKLWNLCKLNWLYLITAIPFFVVTMLVTGVISSPFINALSAFLADSQLNPALALFDLILRFIFTFAVTVFWGMGPCTAGFTYIVRNYGQEEHCWLISDYFERIKLNLKQSFLFWIIDLLVFYFLMGALYFYYDSSIYILVFVLSFATVVYTIMHMYIYQMMITFDLKLRDIIKNSFLLTFACAPRNILLLLILIGIHIGLPILAYLFFQSSTVLLVFIILELCLLPSLSAFTVNFFIHPILHKYVKREPDAE